MSFDKNSTKTETASSDLEAQQSNSTAAPSHKEYHSHHGDVIRDLIIGFSDGLTVPFALCAGLSS